MGAVYIPFSRHDNHIKGSALFLFACIMPELQHPVVLGLFYKRGGETIIIESPTLPSFVAIVVSLHMWYLWFEL